MRPLLCHCERSEAISFAVTAVSFSARALRAHNATLSVTIHKGGALEVTLLGEPVSKGESGRPCLGDPPPAPLTLYTYRG